MQLVDKYDRAVVESESAVTIVGKTLEQANKEQPDLLVRYARLHVEAKSIVRLMDSIADKLRVTLHKQISSTSDRSLTERTIDKFVDGEQEMLDHNAATLEIKMLEEKLGAIVESIKMRGFALNNITKARVEGVHMAVL